MNIQNELLKEHSKKQTDKIVRFIGAEHLLFNDLMDLFFHGNETIQQRSSWVMSSCVEAYPDLIFPYLDKLMENLHKPLHNAVKRNTFRALQFIEIPDSKAGIIADTSFRFLVSRTEAIAVKVFAMSVLYHLCKKEPDFKNELKLSIEDQLAFAGPAFSSRAKKILKDFLVRENIIKEQWDLKGKSS